MGTGSIRTALLGIALVASTFPGPAGAADMLPLRQGRFVDAAAPCDDFSTSTNVGYWGDTLAWGHEVEHIRKVRRTGDRYDVLSFVEGDGGVGGNLRTMRRSTMSITGPDAFRYVRGGLPFRWCAKEFGAVTPPVATRRKPPGLPPSCPGRIDKAFVTFKQGDMPRENADVSGAVTDPPHMDRVLAEPSAFGPHPPKARYVSYRWDVAGMPAPELRCVYAGGGAKVFPIPPNAKSCVEDVDARAARCR